MAKKKYVACSTKFIITPKGPKSTMHFDTLPEAREWNERVGIDFPIKATMGTLETKIAPTSVFGIGIYGRTVKVWRPLKNNEVCKRTR